MERLLSPDEAAERLAVSPKSIRKWLRRGKLKGVKAGRLWRIREQDLSAFLESNEDERSASWAEDPFLKVIGCFSGAPLAGKDVEKELYGEDRL